jgi:hypothetical protein
MSRHASLKILAFYVEGALRPRKASRIASHLAGCSRCTGNAEGLQQVPVLLSSTSFPAIPDNLSYRIEMAIVSESTTRVTVGEPVSSEASRRDLPVRGTGQERRRWRMPVFSSPLAGSLAAVGAAVVIAGGGYEIASHLSSGTPATSSAANPPQSGAAGGAAASGNNASAGMVRVGPEVQFQQHGKHVSVSSVQTSTNFLPATLQVQAQGALQAARLGPLKSIQGAGSPAAVPSSTGTSQRQLTGCVSNIAAGRNVLLVDIALYEGKPATIIVVGKAPAGPGVVYAVGQACSATDADVLAQQNLPQTAP